MKTYNVTITGNQKHISGKSYQNQTRAQVEEILNRYWDINYPCPLFDGNNYELNGDQNICIEEV